MDMRGAAALFFGRYPLEARLARLWSNWGMVMGGELALSARPLGRRGRILLVGGEDALVLQELSLQRDEMLERANAFMDEAFFTDVHVSLGLGRLPLDALPLNPTLRRARAPLPVLSGPPLRGDDAVARSYAAFAAAAGADKH